MSRKGGKEAYGRRQWGTNYAFSAAGGFHVPFRQCDHVLQIPHRNPRTIARGLLGSWSAVIVWSPAFCSREVLHAIGCGRLFFRLRAGLGDDARPGVHDFVGRLSVLADRRRRGLRSLDVLGILGSPHSLSSRRVLRAHARDASRRAKALIGTPPGLLFALVVILLSAPTYWLAGRQSAPGRLSARSRAISSTRRPITSRISASPNPTGFSVGCASGTFVTIMWGSKAITAFRCHFGITSSGPRSSGGQRVNSGRRGCAQLGRGRVSNSDPLASEPTPERPFACGPSANVARIARAL